MNKKEVFTALITALVSLGCLTPERGQEFLNKRKRKQISQTRKRGGEVIGVAVNLPLRNGEWAKICDLGLNAIKAQSELLANLAPSATFRNSEGEWVNPTPGQLVIWGQARQQTDDLQKKLIKANTLIGQLSKRIADLEGKNAEAPADNAEVNTDV